MISDHQIGELKIYKALERDLPMCHDDEMGPLVVGGSNEDTPVQRWFRFKESYSGQLLDKLLRKYLPKDCELRLLDGFCGIGTSVISAQTNSSRRLTAVGIEYNPFIRFVAQTKLRWPEMNPDRMVTIGEWALDEEMAPVSKIPKLSSFTSGRCMSHHVARRLIGIREAINRHGHDADHAALLLGLAASIEPLSRTRKDGRALRIVERPRQRVELPVREKWQQIAEDVREMKRLCPRPNPARILAGDGRRLRSSGIAANSIDVCMTSPPYLNNIDYSEVYKLELWLMGFVANSKEFLKLRKGTLRSHPSSELSSDESRFLKVVTGRPLSESFEWILAKLDTADEKWRRKLFVAYFADTLTYLREQYSVLRPGGFSFIVVGNSLHGGQYAPYVVATDLLICELALSVGFTVEKLTVARTLRRRLSGNHFLRESVIALRKPDGR